MADNGSSSFRDKSNVANSENWGNQPVYGDYEIVIGKEGKPRLLGAGSFGKTYEAVRTDTVGGTVIHQEYVALKVLNPALMSSDSKRLKVVQELVTLTKLDHPNLIHYVRCGEENGEVFYAMELCRGGDLSQLVKRYGPLPEKAVAIIGLQVAAGLLEMDQKHGFVHRDIKPSNIMLVDELEAEVGKQHLAGRLEEHTTLCRIVDYGLVTVNDGTQGEKQRFAGSPMYASPEQVRGEKVDGRSDIYSLGMTLWYLIQGKGPLLDGHGQELREDVAALRRHADSTPHDAFFPVQLTNNFRRVLSRMVAKNVADRYPSAAEVQTALRGYLDEIGGGPAAQVKRDRPSVTRLDAPFETAYALDKRLPDRLGRSCFIVVHRPTGRRLRMTMLADLVDNGEPAGLEKMSEELCGLVRLSQNPDMPPGIMRVREVVWASDLVGVLEEMPAAVSLADVLRVRTEMRRPVSFSEIVGVLYTIAESLDYLVDLGMQHIFMPCEEVWLVSDDDPAELLSDHEALAEPLTEWPGLLPVISMLWLPREGGDAANTQSNERTLSSLDQLSETARHPVTAFCRLIYKVVSGTEIAVAAEVRSNDYVQTAALGAASNNLIRDLVAAGSDRPRVADLLADLCRDEGVMKAKRSTSASRTARTSAASFTHASPESTAARTTGRSQMPEKSRCAFSSASASQARPDRTAGGREAGEKELKESEPRRGINAKLLALAALALVVIAWVVMSLFHEPPSVVVVQDPPKPVIDPVNKRPEPSPTPKPQPAPVPSPTPKQPPALSVPDGYPTIEAALVAAKPGETVRIKSGAYEEKIRLPDGVSLAAEESRRVLISVDGKLGSVLEADGCKTAATIKGIVFSHSGADAVAGGGAPVVNVIASKVGFEDCVFEKGLGPGLLVTAAARVSLTRCESRRNGAHGVFVKNASVDLKECSAESNLTDGLRAFGAGSDVKLDKTVARRNGGTGIVAEGGARIVASQTDSMENAVNGLDAQDADTQAIWQEGIISGNGVTVVGGAPRDSGKGGLGVSLDLGGVLFSATGTVITGNWKHGVQMKMPRSGSSLVKCRVSGSHRSGVIIYGASDTKLRIEGGEITNSHEDGLIISGSGFRPEIAGLKISGSTLTGLTVYEMAEPQLQACVLDGNGQGAMNRDEAGPGMTVR